MALEVRLENARLARVLGLAPFLVCGPEPSQPVRRGSPEGDARSADRRTLPMDQRRAR